MENNHPHYSRAFLDVVDMFQVRVADRYLRHVHDLPADDNDLVFQAQRLGLTDQMILDACIKARKFLSCEVGLELVSLTEKEIADSSCFKYADYTGNPNLN